MKISKPPLGQSSFPPSALPRGLGPLLFPKAFLDAYQPQVRNTNFIMNAAKNAAANIYINGFRDDRIYEKLKAKGKLGSWHDTSRKIDIFGSSMDG